MADIKIVWDALNMRGDWQISNGDLATGDDLETAVLIMLFSDAALPLDVEPPDGTDDHRGWAGDTYNTAPIGSLLWTLRRASISNVSATIQRVEDICEKALEPLLTNGVAKSVSVVATYFGNGTIAIEVTITQPSGVVRNFKYQWAWASVE